MQVYSRISAPFLEGPAGQAALVNVASLQTPGQLGSAFNDQNSGKSWLTVKLDSGATAANAVGVVASGQLAFWKDKAAGIVTNDKRFSDCSSTTSGFVNRVAGIFQTAVTAGYYCNVVIAGRSVQVGTVGSGGAGLAVLADTTASNATAIVASTATTAPVSEVIGYALGAAANNLMAVEVNLGFVNG